MHTIGCVSYLNAVPLVDGIDGAPEVRVKTDVPSRLLDELVVGRTSIALCPAIDYQTSRRDLCVVPVGGIGSAGETLTVRVFSRQPLADVERVSVDGDSRTSVALMRLVFRELYGTAPSLSSLRLDPTAGQPENHHDAVLMIGDKVVSREPDAARYPHQMDLGEAWHRLTGRPFVFAAWMAPVGHDLGTVPRLLEETRHRNCGRLADIAALHAESHGWSRELAVHYLGSLLRYELGRPELEAMEFFWRRCHEIGLIETLRPLVLYGD